MIRVINALLAIIGGVGAALLLFWILNKLAEMLPQKGEERTKPWVFILPAIAAIGDQRSGRRSQRRGYGCCPATRPATMPS